MKLHPDKIINGDSLVELTKLDDNSVDSVITDPPYGIDFMLKDWDKGLPSIEIWKECFRVMKDGSFIFVMCIPKSSIQARMILMLEEAGFIMDFTPIYWAYASGFPKAMNIGKAVDKRLGFEREVIGNRNQRFGLTQDKGWNKTSTPRNSDIDITKPTSKEAKELDGSYAGYQPKPAVEVILVGMKPLSEKTYVDQAMKNKKGITWLDDVRMPVTHKDIDIGIRKFLPHHKKHSGFAGDQKGEWGSDEKDKRTDWEHDKKGRFPANLVVSDDVLNDGKITKGDKREFRIGRTQGFWSDKPAAYLSANHNDQGSFSRYFDIDNWFHQNINLEDLSDSIQKTFPFVITPKPQKSEKNEGLEGDPNKPAFNEFRPTVVQEPNNWKIDPRTTPFAGANRTETQINNHPTVKPIKLMSYLITLGSRENDVILDPFLGSGTTAIACVLTNRKYIGVELDKDYFEIAMNRLKYHEKKVKEKEKSLDEWFE